MNCTVSPKSNYYNLLASVISLPRLSACMRTSTEVSLLSANFMMDIEIDSDLSDECGLFDGPIEPYCFEPLRQSLVSHVSDDDVSSSSDHDHAAEEFPEDVEQQVDVSEWY